jgi:hypothetical protein
VAGCCEYDDEPSGSGATELVGWLVVWSVGWLLGWLVGYPHGL